MGWFAELFRFAAPTQPASEATAVSRRELLTGGFLRSLPAAPTPVLRWAESLERGGAFFRKIEDNDAREAKIFPLLRPPGAKEERAFLASCSRCGDCVRACPHQAISLASARMRQAADTPVINASEHPCLMCSDTPCITACPTGALQRTPDTVFPIMGTARIATHNCLAWQGTTCVTCQERCPAIGAITLDAHCRPIISAESCTGCGVCQHVCPAPQNAILIMPAAHRPVAS